VLASDSARQRTASISHAYRFIFNLLVETTVILAGSCAGEPTIRPEDTKTKSTNPVLASAGFAPIARGDARVLILGSLPGTRSLHEAEYYAHPQNAFWPIMRELFSVEGGYERRCEQLVSNGIAVWDVLARSVRPGSMDADIQMRTAEVNDFDRFFSEYPDVRLICFNGQKAAQMFKAMVQLEQSESMLRFETLPSTSPAYAAIDFAEKLSRWRNIICNSATARTAAY
jgi:TDG/mug DNA glycosylase family protein